MVFRSRRRAEMAQAVAQGTAALERRLQTQLDSLARTEATFIEAVQATRRETERRESALVQVLELVSDLCRHAIEITEADRMEHQDFLASLTEVMRPIIATSESTMSVGPPSGSAVLGGTVFAAPIDVDLVEVDDTEHPHPVSPVRAPDVCDGLVEVRGRFGDDWVGGFEVCAGIEHDGVLQYQLRRCSDGSVLPELFDAADIRPIDRPLRPQQPELWPRL